MLSWDAVEKKIANAHNYWVCTTRPDGRPHTVPVWGVWVDGAVYFGTDRDSRKARNILANPAMVIHLELLKEGDRLGPNPGDEVDAAAVGDLAVDPGEPARGAARPARRG